MSVAASTCRAVTAALLLIGMAGGWPQPAAGADDTAERGRIAAERAAAEARFIAREQECRQRFVVSDCVDQARRERRDALDALRARLLPLDEARRRERSAERSAEIAAKAADDSKRQRERAARATSASPASAPSRSSVAHPKARAAAQRSQGIEQRRSREAQKRADFEARHRQATERRERVLGNAAKRMQQHSPAASLPVPGASVSGAASAVGKKP